MRFSALLPLAAVSTALVIPDEDVMSQIAVESHKTSRPLVDEAQSNLPSKDAITDFFGDSMSSLIDNSKDAVDDAADWVTEKLQAAAYSLEDEFFDVKSWIETTEFEATRDGHDEGHRDHRPGHRRPRHPHNKPNRTVYELISESKYTTKLAAAINEDEFLVDLLNGTSANFTVFAPIDKAFEKIPDHGEKPSKEIIRKVLSYHVSPDFYPAGRVLVTKTVPTTLAGEYLSDDPESTPQRLSTNVGLRGLTVNYYSRIVAINIFGTNGVIHAVESILIPPPKATKVISFLPGQFSTLELGLVKTGLYETLNDTSNHLGGTIFAPSNFAFQKLPARITAFLFSSHGLKYLEALLKYHVVPNQSLYSDAFYKSSSSSDTDTSSIPKGKFHVDLPTLLEDRYLSIDIGRYGRLIDIRINGFQSVSAPDGIVKDGVIHVINNVIIPPKRLSSGELKAYDGEELTVEDLKERLEPFVGSKARLNIDL